MLKVQHITTGYGKKQVLTNISFDVNKGEIVLLTGGNGSGKSTVLKTIYGLLKPWTQEGKIFFEGKEITGMPTSGMIKLGIVYIPQKKNVFEDFTVAENLLTSASIYPKLETKERLEYVFTTIPHLAELRKRVPFHMSGGEKQLLAFGNALIHTPKLILFDEPFAGVDISNSKMLNDCIRQLNENQTTFIIVEHKKYLFGEFRSKEVELGLGQLKINKNIQND